LPVIESYPGAAQDVLSIPRKGAGNDLLQKGLSAFGFEIQPRLTHDELDAITSALTGYFFLANEYEAIGAEDEGFMILPQWRSSLRWSARSSVLERPRAISLLGLPGAGKTTVARAVAGCFGWKRLSTGEELRRMSHTQPNLASQLAEGQMGPEGLVLGVVAQAVASGGGSVLVLDGFPRHVGQLDEAIRLFSEIHFVCLQLDADAAARRAKSRLTCTQCGWVCSHKLRHGLACPVCNLERLVTRPEDIGQVSGKRVEEAERGLHALLQRVAPGHVITVDADPPASEVIAAVVLQLQQLSW
jgi:adenylate kinase family enzyme